MKDFSSFGVAVFSRRIFIAIALTLVVLLSACSDSITEPLAPQISSVAEGAVKRSNITKEDAVVIADKVLKSSKTRSGLLTMPSFDYVVSDNNTRSISVPDTLAYVLNYPNDGGFVIVASDRRVYPVLAFSDKGNFSFANEIAKVNFIDNIEAYMSQADPDADYDVNDTDFAGCYQVNPIVGFLMGQGSPWNKYVVEDDKDYLAGCVAVATAQIMCYSKYAMIYHGSTYYLNSIKTAITNGPNYVPANRPARIVGGGTGVTNPEPVKPEYSYDQAVDWMAKLLYWIGKDVTMTYGTKESTASVREAYKLFTSLNFIVPTDIIRFNINDVTQYLNTDHIIFMKGYSTGGEGSHAWVADGCYFCVDYEDRTTITSTYIHCDWGWSGYCNGYYSGEVFATPGYTWKPTSYFAIKRQYK